MVINGAWIYKEVPDVQMLRVALEKLIAVYPHLTGHYQEKGKMLVWESEYCNEPTLDTCNNADYAVNQLIGNDELVW